MAYSYSDRLKNLATLFETMTVKTIGKKLLIDYVVSSMITAKEYVNLVYPASAAEAPQMM